MTDAHDNRLALITGGAGHIGEAIASALAAKGCNIILLDKDSDKLSECCAALQKKFPVKILPLAVNLSVPDAFTTVVDFVANNTTQVDYLVNNAAFYDEMPGWSVPFEDEGYEAWMMVLRVNLLAPFFLAQKLAPMLKKSSQGCIINISSIYGMVAPDWSLYEGTDMTNEASYAASKGGLNALSRWLATQLAPEVRVNGITVGGIFRHQDPKFVERYEKKTPLGRMATEQDIAQVVDNLLSPSSSYITGQNIIVDGGWTTW